MGSPMAQPTVTKSVVSSQIWSQMSVSMSPQFYPRPQVGILILVRFEFTFFIRLSSGWEVRFFIFVVKEFGVVFVIEVKGILSFHVKVVLIEVGEFGFLLGGSLDLKSS